MKYTAAVFDTKQYSLGEGPYYDPRFGRLSWVDIHNGQLWTLLPDGTRTCFNLGQPVGAAVPLKDSEGFLLAAQDGLYQLENGKAELICDLSGTYQPFWRSNDAKADPCGRLWFGGTVGDGVHPADGNLYCYDGGRIVCMQEKTKIANGMAWSSDHKTFYFSDSLEYAASRYDYDAESGRISGRKVLFKVENGVPDGMCIDAEDNLWLAVWGGHRIERRCGRTGRKLEEIEVPAEHVSSCCFGGEDLKTLYITSSGKGLSGTYDGCLFTCRVDTAGVAPDYADLTKT